VDAYSHNFCVFFSQSSAIWQKRPKDFNQLVIARLLLSLLWQASFGNPHGG